jgi:hypothetical protein
MLNRPVWNEAVKGLIPKNEWELAADEEKNQLDQAMLKAMESKERRRFEREQRKLAAVESDLEPERMVIEQMELTKKMIGSVNAGGDLVYERVLALIIVEEGDTTQDYQLIINANECVVKPMKNKDSRLAPQDLGFLVYGRNVGKDHERVMRDLLLTCRSPLRAIQPSRTALKEIEIEAVTEESQGKDLPDGWLFDGRQYMTFDGDVKYEHPNIKDILAKALDAENDKIAAYNRQVEKEHQQDKAKYEC